jgi:hypothetical protein
MLGLPTGSIGAIVASLVNMLLILLGFASMIAFLWAGFKYLFAAGDEDEAKSAKKAVKFSIYGIIVALSGVVVIQAVTAFLDGAGLF